MKAWQIEIAPQEEAAVRMTKEVLDLFSVQTVPANDAVDFAKLSIVHEVCRQQPVTVKTTLSLWPVAGERQVFCEQGEAMPYEAPKAAWHRLLKRNLYHIFQQNFSLPPAPWGILHGVRPLKIVHHWLDEDPHLHAEAIVQRLQADYEVSTSKANDMAQIAFLQRPFMAQTTPKTISVYVGIPFCLSRCLYCSFPAYVLPPEEQSKAFFQAWNRDLQTVQAAIEHYDLQVQSVYVGGGTPTSLDNEHFRTMLQTVKHAFITNATQEFTVEAGRPDSLNATKAEIMQELGVTRVSLNPQTMQARTLRYIGRKHTPEDIRQRFAELRHFGSFAINMDVILGLPGETRDDVADTMRQVLALHPDDVTLHALALKRGSRLKEHIAAHPLPSDEETRAMFAVARQQIEAAGLRPYYLYRQGYMRGQLENIGCALPGKESWYNIQIMGERQTILGVGCGATSKIVETQGTRLKASFQPKDLLVYMRDIDAHIQKRAALLQEVYG